MSYISSLNNPDPSREYITLSTSLAKGEKVDITGWYLKSETTGNWVSIGKASTIPFPYSVNTNEDIVLKSGDRVYLVKGFSPIGIAWRSNKCTGYFQHDRTFYPRLQNKCPLERDEDLPKFSNVLDRQDECVDLIERIGRCAVPKNIRDLPDTVTSSCKSYLETQVNYNTCVARHFGDADFPGAEWYYYFKVFGPLWRQKRETINLHDNTGLIVATIKY